MVDSPRITPQTLRVLDALLSSSAGVEMAGADIGKATGLASGTLYPILLRLEEAGLVVSEWEAQDPQTLGRPRRRFYRVTALGTARARAAAKQLRSFVGGLSWA